MIYLNGNEIDRRIQSLKLKEKEYLIINNIEKCHEEKTNLIKHIFVRNLPREKQVSCNNSFQFLNVLKSMGYDIDDFMKKNGFSDKYRNITEWITMNEICNFVEAFQKYIGNTNCRLFEKYAIIAMSAPESLHKLIAIWLLSFPFKTIFKFVPIFNRNYNNNFLLQYIDTKRTKNFCYITLAYKVIENFISHRCRHFKRPNGTYFFPLPPIIS